MSKKERFLFLDSSYEVHGREPVIVLWGINDRGERVVLFDERFRPYFYALVRKGEEKNINIAKIRALSKARSPIVEVSPVDRKYFGRLRKAVRITTVIPEYVREYREEIKKFEWVEEVLEADIRFAMRYIVDNRLFPFSWYEAEVEEVNARGYRVDKAYRIISDMKEVIGYETKMPELRILAFDIEVYSESGSPKPERDPVIIIATMTNNGEKRLFLARDNGKTYSDKESIEEFINYVRDYDPDIIVGYNSNEFDWPYLVERSHILGIKLDVGRRVGVEPATSVHGHISIAGRLNVDLYNYAEEMHEIKVKSLEEVAEYLGVMKKKDRVIINWWEIPAYWRNKEKRKILLQYALDDVTATSGLAEKILPFAIQLSRATGVPLDQVGAMSVGFRLEWYLIRAAFDMNELVPNREQRREESYKGAIVLKPVKGVHENIAVLDFSSMYPNVMIKYNVGPDTLVRSPEECPEISECNVAPEVGHMFLKKPPGFFKTVLENLLTLRKKIRNEMKKYDPSSLAYRLLDERQKAVKILANAAYGYMGWSGARWYCRQCAEAVTAWGRNLIRRAISYANRLGLKVIYGDTDSIFVKYDKDKVAKLIEFIEREMGFEIKIDKIYRRVFFTEAKKRYAGLLEDGRIDIVGFEAVRGDWSELAKEVQSRVTELVLETGNVNEAIKYVRNIVAKIQKREIPLEKLVIWKTLSKRLEEYEAEAPHVAAARRLIKAGYKVSSGDKIGYVIVRGGGKISSRAYPYFMVKVEDIDTDYYIDHQVIPAALRILSYFGVTEKQLKATTRGQRSIFEFLAKKQ